MENLKTKYFKQTLDLVENLTEDHTYVFEAPGHHLHGRALAITKGDGEYEFETTSIIPKGLQTHKEIQFERSYSFNLVNEHHTLYLKGSNYFVNHINYIEDSIKLSKGVINGFTIGEVLGENEKKFYRCVVPVGPKEKLDLKDFQKTFYSVGKGWSTMFVCNVEGCDFDLLSRKREENYYFLMDCLEPVTEIKFQKYCYNILLAIGFLRGDLVLNECFVFAYDHETFEEPVYVEFTSMRTSVFSNQPLITTNPYSVRLVDEDFERDERGMISEAQKEKIYEGVVDVSAAVFSKLVTLFYKEEKLQRAALLYILGHTATLEIRIPNYYIALEAITSYLARTVKNDSKRLNPIKDKKIANDLIEDIKLLIQDKKIENALTDEEINIDVLFKNIDRLNSPPNADKLARSFDIIGYELSDEQKKVIKLRNSYLHGSFLKLESEDQRFKDALHLSLRLHFLIGVLLLKQVGYEGKVINYAKLWTHITEKEVDEEVLVNIYDKTDAI
ncbi:hypothetical protein QSE00_12450 [Arenibacter sp. M-2]|uniref:hypothetical protein n=1 Tax=Arenibacter sp. M-2 TaxID=3053612 RepID=UPI00256FEF33|nr:hypothetical protein [Arenibacter sp. M-2]MDL5512632.1 hypothetical protein [Arenibacter sp. M-2]